MPGEPDGLWCDGPPARPAQRPGALCPRERPVQAVTGAAYGQAVTGAAYGQADRRSGRPWHGPCVRECGPGVLPAWWASGHGPGALSRRPVRAAGSGAGGGNHTRAWRAGRALLISQRRGYGGWARASRVPAMEPAWAVTPI